MTRDPARPCWCQWRARVRSSLVSPTRKSAFGWAAWRPTSGRPLSCPSRPRGESALDRPLLRTVASATPRVTRDGLAQVVRMSVVAGARPSPSESQPRKNVHNCPGQRAPKEQHDQTRRDPDPQDYETVSIERPHHWDALISRTSYATDGVRGERPGETTPPCRRRRIGCSSWHVATSGAAASQPR